MTTTHTTHSSACASTSTAPPAWPLERALFAMAGTVTLLSALGAAVLSPWFLLVTAFVGLSQWLYVLVGACPASLVLSRAFGLRSAAAPVKEMTR